MSFDDADQRDQGVFRQQRRDKTPVNQDTQRLVEQLSDSLGAAVVLEMGKNGKGTLTISFKGLDVLQGIIEKLDIVN